MDSYYMLVPITTKQEDWIHQSTDKLSIEKAKEIQEFLMGRQTELYTKESTFEVDEVTGETIEIKHGDLLQCNFTHERIVNNCIIINIDSKLMELYYDEMVANASINNCTLYTHGEMLEYLKQFEGEPV